MFKPIRLLAKSILATSVLALLPANAALAQAYPSKPVSLIVPFAAGGPTDTIARLYGEQLSKALGQPFLVENVVGAGGVTGTNRAGKAAPDGYTFLVHNVAPHVAGPALYAGATYNPVTDFEPVASLAEAAIYIVVRKDFPAKTLKEFLDYGKANPGKISFASAGSGSATHLACELLKLKAGIDMLHVPYRGTGPALNDLISGKVDMMCDQGLNVGQQLKAETVRALAIAQDSRSKAFPEVPTTKEAGLEGLIVNASTAIYAPKGTPAPVIKALSDALDKAASSDLIKQRLEQLVSERPSGDRMTPEGLKRFTAEEFAKWTTTIKSSGIKIN
ncbi:MAG: tripartite tricarboxylate transporter substrate-binding protein [Beijerinckiaceae bacterium]|nr:tripartite tricarboxylate transporter substrate-binding protein [Beijerinckiaceae bacterium]